MTNAFDAEQTAAMMRPPPPLNLSEEIARLSRLPISGLRSRYAELYGDATRSGNRDHLVRRIVWRLQADREGGLPERARQRAMAIAKDADLRVRAPRPMPTPPGSAAATTITGYLPRADRRMPAPGTVLRKEYKGRTIIVRVLPSGFEFDGVVHASLSAIANLVTGGHWNGTRFFGLGKSVSSNAGKATDE